MAREERERIAVIKLDGDWAAYWRERSSNLRTALDKEERRLRRAGRVAFADSARTGEWADTLEEGLALEARGWKGRQGSAILQSPAQTRFYRRIAESTARTGRLRVFSLRLDDRLIAFYLAVAEQASLFWLKVAYDEDLARYGPAMILFRGALAACFADPALRAARIPGAPAWTARWGARDESLVSIRAVPAGSLMAFAARAEALARRARRAWPSPDRHARRRRSPARPRPRGPSTPEASR